MNKYLEIENQLLLYKSKAQVMQMYIDLLKKIDKLTELLDNHDRDTGTIYYKYNNRFVISELKERIREVLGDVDDN